MLLFSLGVSTLEARNKHVSHFSCSKVATSYTTAWEGVRRSACGELGFWVRRVLDRLINKLLPSFAFSNELGLEKNQAQPLKGRQQTLGSSGVGHKKQ